MDKKYLGKKRMYEILKGEFPFAPLMKECKYEKHRGTEWVSFSYYSKEDDEVYACRVFSFCYGEAFFAYKEYVDDDLVHITVDHHRISLAEPSESERVSVDQMRSEYASQSEDEGEVYILCNEEDEKEMSMEDYIAGDCDYCNASSCRGCWKNEEDSDDKSEACDACDDGIKVFDTLDEVLAYAAENDIITYEENEKEHIITQEEWVSHFDDWKLPGYEPDEEFYEYAEEVDE